MPAFSRTAARLPPPRLRISVTETFASRLNVATASLHRYEIWLDRLAAIHAHDDDSGMSVGHPRFQRLDVCLRAVLSAIHGDRMGLGGEDGGDQPSQDREPV